MKSMKTEYKKTNELLLDSENARFAELYSGSKKETDLIEYLLYTEAADEVAENISNKKQYYPDEVLWVLPHEEKFLVKDGNRRCAAVKALKKPKKHDLDLPKMDTKRLPVLVYENEDELERRVQEQHTHSLFREWDRIAKALKAHEMHNSGSSRENILELDSRPSQLIKLASFYYTAVNIAGDDLKKLLRRGRGNTGGKTIIFERLFRYRKRCGYKFKNKPSYQIKILDKDKFSEYITALVEYLKDNPNTKHQDVDKEKSGFLKRLKDYGFVPGKSEQRLKKHDKGKGSDGQDSPTRKRGSAKSRPTILRKQVAPKLKHLINECYSLDNIRFANATVVISRVTFEAVLKYVIEETKYKDKRLFSYNYFHDCFFSKGGRSYTKFNKLKNKFTDLIINLGTKNSFKQFDLDRLHQIVHNYKVGAKPSDARIAKENLIHLIEFMLQDATGLCNSLDAKKLI